MGEDITHVGLSMALTRSGEVWSWGKASSALGHGSLDEQVVPKKVAALKGHIVTQLANGGRGAQMTAAVTADGALYTFGDGGSGQLGHGDLETQWIPKRVELAVWRGKRVVSVSCGRQHTAVVLDDGTLFTFGGLEVPNGGKQCGQLGHGDKENRLLPTCVNLAAWHDKHALSVSCGLAHTAAIFDDGSLYTFGRGKCGRLGHGDEEDQLAPKRVDPTEWSGKRVVSVACGRIVTAAIVDDGALYTFGNEPCSFFRSDAYFDLTPKRMDPTYWLGKHVVSVSCASEHMAVILSDGALYTFGNGNMCLYEEQRDHADYGGWLGHGDSQMQKWPKRVEPTEWRGKRVLSVACFDGHTAATLDNGALYTFGTNARFALGHGDEEKEEDEVQVSQNRVEKEEWRGKRLVSVSCGAAHTAVVLGDGSLYTFGSGRSGCLGHGDEEDQSTPKRVEVPAWHGKRVMSVSCGDGCTGVILDDGGLYTFGYDEFNELGHGYDVSGEGGQLSPKRVNPTKWIGKRVLSIACADEHSAAILDDGSLYIFGNGQHGQCGLGGSGNDEGGNIGGDDEGGARVYPAEWRGKRAVSVSCCSDHTAVVLNDGSLYTFGGGDQRGSLGLGDVVARYVPTLVEHYAEPSGAKLPLPPVVGVITSISHAAAWTQDGRVFCWGVDFAHGKLGITAAAANGAAAADTAGAPAETLMEEMRSRMRMELANPHLPREVAGLPRAAKGGWCHSCTAAFDHVIEVVIGPCDSTFARTREGRVFAWGRGLGGQLGLGATLRDHDVPRLMGPVQGRFVDGVFTAHDGCVWLSCAADGAKREARADDEAPPHDVRNPMQLLDGADLEAGHAQHDALVTMDEGLGGTTRSIEM
jgi:RCC1 and BTB domain-containing protein